MEAAFAQSLRSLLADERRGRGAISRLRFPRGAPGRRWVVLRGALVRCGVTGVPIPLEELKYWSVDLQEAYASPQAVLQRLQPQAGQELSAQLRQEDRE